MAYNHRLRSRAIFGSAASTLVLAALLQGGFANQASAQAKPKAAAAADNNTTGEGTEVEQVVVTGTFLRGTPATAVVPVEGVNLEELRDRGSPSNLDFVKGLSEIGSVAGEANRLNAFAIGAASINLRNLGSQRTIVVFNGRRFPEQYSFSVGRFNNINQIPNAAIGRVEVLKDGGATTYGADAVGGVVNYITRRNLDGVEVSANYRYIKNSDGDYDASISMGKVEDKWNIMGVLGYQRRSELDLQDRSWALRDYLFNPSGWNTGGQPGAFEFQINNNAFSVAGSTTGTPLGTPTNQNYNVIAAAPIPTSAGSTGGNGTLLQTSTTSGLTFNEVYTGNRQMGATGIMRDPSCNALGGFAGWSGTPSAICYIQFNYLSNLVEEQSTWQGYAEANYEFSPKFKLHGEFTYYDVDIPRIPIDNGGALLNSFPLARTNDTPTGQLLVNGSGAPTGASQTVPTVLGATTPAYFVSGFNPAVGNMLGLLRNADGSLSFTPGQIAAISTPVTIGGALMAGGRVALPSASWRPFGYGGNPIYGETDFQHNFNTQYRYTIDFSGDIGKVFGGSWDWDFAYTLNTLDYNLVATDMLVDRLQAALNGFGGAACNGIRAGQTGSSGCEYFNPFATSIAKNIFTGAVNPFFVGSGTFAGYLPGKGLQNDPDLIRWMYVPVSLHRTSDYAIFDAVVRGDLDYHLWSKDPIQVAIGAQYRELHEISDLSDFADESINPCATAGLQITGCTQTSPLVFRRGANISGFVRDYDRRYPVESAFAEVKVPVTDKLNLQVSTRYEKFFSDLDAKDNEVVVSQGAVRYQALPWLAFRGTAGQTFTQVNPPAPATPIVAVAASLPAAQGGAAAGQFIGVNYSNVDVKPETGFNYNIGAIFQVGDVTATIDYYDIRIDNLIRAQTTAQLLQAITVPGTTGTTALANCGSDLLSAHISALGGNPFIQPVAGVTCTQGVTTVGQLVNNGRVNFFGSQGQQTALVNGGTLETAGVDFNVQWRKANVLGGEISLGADLTFVTKYKQGDYVVSGVTVAAGYDNGVGILNSGPGHNGQRVAQYRGSISGNYRFGIHNFNWRTSVISSEINDDPSGLLAQNATNANIPNALGFVNPGASNCAITPTTPPVPSAGGTGTFGTPGTNLGATGTPVGFDTCQNTSITTGTKIPASFTSDFTYRITLPAQTSMSLAIQNVFDTDPKFSRDFINYDAFSGSPLGRTYRIGITKKW